jgi:hypothetical protein
MSYISYPRCEINFFKEAWLFLVKQGVTIWALWVVNLGVVHIYRSFYRKELEFFFFLVPSGIGPRAMHILVKCSTTWSSPKSLCIYFIFEIESQHLFAWTGPELTFFLPCLLSSWDYKHTISHLYYFWRSKNYITNSY